MKTPKFLPGDFYAAYDPKRHAYQLYRVLIAEPSYGAIHVSVYSNLYPQLPKSVNLEELHFSILQVSTDGEQASVSFQLNEEGMIKSMLENMAAPDKNFGIMHIPLSLAGFDTGDLEYVQHEPLEEKDLQGFRAYLEGMENSENDSQEYINYILNRSHDRYLFDLHRWVKWVLPLLAVLLAGLYLSGWVHPAVPLVLLSIVVVISWFWWGKVMRNLWSVHRSV